MATPQGSTAAPAPPSRFRGRFLSDPETLSRFGAASGPIRIPPLAVARPADAEDLGRLVRWAATRGVHLVPRGAGTGMPGGNVGPGVSVDLSALDALDAVDPDARTLRVGPGVTGASVRAAASEKGLFLPALPSSAERCTVGGMVANNAAGARSFRHGAVREWVEELDLVLADGQPLTVARGGPAGRFEELRRALGAHLGTTVPPWPAVRKNASGYALDRFVPTGDAVDLFVGSEGTLGVITGVRLRLAPEPAGRALALLPVPDADGLHAGVAAAHRLDASACEFLGDRFLGVAGLRTRPDTAALMAGASALLLVELAGPADAVHDGLEALGSLAGDLGVTLRSGRSPEERARLWELRHAASPMVAARARDGLVSMQFIEDSVVRPERLAHYLLGLDEILREEETDAVVFGHAGDGNVHVNPLVDVRRADWRERVARILEGTVDLVARLGGTLSGEHGDGRIRAPFHPRVFGTSVAEGFCLVKRTLDPAGILNPGVVVALPGQDPLEGISDAARVG